MSALAGLRHLTKAEYLCSFCSSAQAAQCVYWSS